MIRTIRGAPKVAAIVGAIILLAQAARSQQPSTRGLPEAPGLAPPMAGPGIGRSPGTLEPSEFSSDGISIIGGRARGGANRVPRKVGKPNQARAPEATRGASELGLPPALPDGILSGPDEASANQPMAAVVEDVGPPDGLTLDQALSKMMAANLDLLALKYEIPQADADILTAGLRANPLLYADTQFIPYGAYTAARPLGPTEYDISITHPLDVSHKRRSRVEVARAAKSTLEAQFQDAVRRQVGNLYRAFVDFQAARLDVLTAESVVKVQEGIVRGARRRAGAGDDLGRLEARLGRARDSLEDARHELDDVRESVALLMNLPPAEAAQLQPRGGLRVAAPPPPPIEELTRLALATRPDVVAVRRGIDRAGSEVKLARASRVDDVFLFYDPFTYQDNRASHQPSGRSWSVGLTVPLPVYNRNQGNIARARSNLSQTQVELAALERRVSSEVRLADREYRNSLQALERAERTTLPHAREDQARIAADLAVGKLGLGDYLHRLDDDNDALRDYRDALVRHRRSMLDLNTAAGCRLLP